MNEFIISRFRWRFFSTLELGFDIDNEFENAEVVISEEIERSQSKSFIKTISN